MINTRQIAERTWQESADNSCAVQPGVVTPLRKARAAIDGLTNAHSALSQQITTLEKRLDYVCDTTPQTLPQSPSNLAARPGSDQLLDALKRLEVSLLDSEKRITSLLTRLHF